MFLSDITALFCAGQTCELYSRAEHSPLWAPCDINGNAPVRMLLNMGSLRSSSLESLSHHGTTPAIPQAPPGSPSWNQSLCSSSAETHTHTHSKTCSSFCTWWMVITKYTSTHTLPSLVVCVQTPITAVTHTARLTAITHITQRFKPFVANKRVNFITNMPMVIKEK